MKNSSFKVSMIPGTTILFQMTTIDYHLKSFYRASRTNEFREIAPTSKMARVPRSGLSKCRNVRSGKNSRFDRGRRKFGACARCFDDASENRYLLQRVWRDSANGWHRFNFTADYNFVKVNNNSFSGRWSAVIFSSFSVSRIDAIFLPFLFFVSSAVSIKRGRAKRNGPRAMI